jgi:hypothetical protein
MMPSSLLGDGVGVFWERTSGGGAEGLSTAKEKANEEERPSKPPVDTISPENELRRLPRRLFPPQSTDEGTVDAVCADLFDGDVRVFTTSIRISTSERSMSFSFSPRTLGAYLLEPLIFEVEFLGDFLEVNVCLDAIGFVGAYLLFEGGHVQ